MCLFNCQGKNKKLIYANVYRNTINGGDSQTSLLPIFPEGEGTSVHRLLFHSKTKNELSSYLDYAMETILRAVMTWRCQCRATHQNVNHLQSEQEEADTKMLLHALDATANDAA